MWKRRGKREREGGVLYTSLVLGELRLNEEKKGGVGGVYGDEEAIAIIITTCAQTWVPKKNP